MNARPEHLVKLAEAERRLLETWLIEFDQSWRDGRLAERVRELPPAGHPLRLAALIELVKIDLERQWELGRRVVLENYIQLYPELATSSAVEADLIQMEQRVRRDYGTLSGLTDVAVHLPKHGEELRRPMREDPETVPQPVPVSFSQQPTGPANDPVPPPGKALVELPVQIGRYRLVEQLAQGGMGVVVRVHDPDLDRSLAVKIMLPRLTAFPDAERRLLGEARLTAQLQHPGIPPVHEVGRLDNGLPFFAMKLIEGQTLAQLLEERDDQVRRPGEEEKETEPHSNSSSPHLPISSSPHLLGIFRQVCQTMAFAHARGVIHRDLKPSNIMVGAFGEVQVMDWGLAKVLPDDGAEGRPKEKPEADTICSLRVPPSSWPGTQTGIVLGTPAYMAPEQARGVMRGLDERCDVFSLGAILCEILTGRPPYNHGCDPEQMRLREDDLIQTLARLEKLRHGAGAALADLAQRCLAPNQQDRPRHAGEVTEAVERFEAQVQQRLRQAELERAQAHVQAEEERKRREVEQARAEEERRRRQAEHAQLVAERRRRRALLLSAGAGLLLLAGAAGGTLWYQYDQGERLAEKVGQQTLSEQGMDTALKQARQIASALQAELKKEGGVFRLLNNPTAWKQRIELAWEALKRARWLQARAETEVADELRREADALESLLKQQDGDWTVAVRLEKIREDRPVRVDDKWDFARAGREYPRVFAQAGVNLRIGRADKIVLRIQQSAIKEQLLSALDDWALVATHDKDKSLSPQLLLLARRVDPDPWRDQVRVPFVPSNRAKLNALAAKALVDQSLFRRLSPQMLQLVGSRLSGTKEEERWLRQAQQLHPTDFWLNFVLGNTLYKVQPQQAEGFYRAALAVRPQFGAAWNNLGRALVKQKDFKGAEAAYRRAIECNGRFALAWCNLGMVRWDQGNHQGAIDAYRHALAINPKLARVWHGLGCALHRQKKLEEAIAAFHRALRLDPDLEGCWCNLGIALRHHKDLKGAIAAYHEELKRNRRSPIPWTNLGLALRQSGDLEGAIRAYHEALKCDEKFAVAWLNLGNALRAQKDDQGAITAFRRAVHCDPQSAQACLFLGNALFAQGNWKEAAQLYQQVLRIDPNYGEAHLNLGSMLSRHGSSQQAIPHLIRALELGCCPPRAHYALAHALYRQRDLTRAIEHFRQALKLGLNNTCVHQELGLALRDTKDRDGAIQQLSLAVALAPYNAYAHSDLGLLLRDQGRFAEGLQHLRRGHELGCHDPQWPDHSGLRIQQCERLVQLDQKLATVLQGKAKVENAQVLLQLAEFCRRYKRDPAAAVRFYAAAFVAKPSLAEDLSNNYRYHAACCAAAAASGRSAQGK
jgi:serine/threonine protein kinase/Flp pilus assembly protein TadD